MAFADPVDDKNHGRISVRPIGSGLFRAGASHDLFSGFAAFSYYLYRGDRLAG